MKHSFGTKFENTFENEKKNEELLPKCSKYVRIHEKG
jgi:hypothetical protein